MTEASETLRLGLIVNPVAGLGGRVGLKGSDGEEVQRRALSMGAVPMASNRAVQTLTSIGDLTGIELMVWAGQMGEAAAIDCDLPHTVLGSSDTDRTNAEDTRKSVESMVDAGVGLILFTGGDGTARDVHDVVGTDIPALGIPAGVKIHSAAFATNPVAAGQLASLFIRGKTRQTREMEVLDIDEEALRRGEIAVRLYGYLDVPFRTSMIQNLKSTTAPGEDAAMHAIAASITGNMDEDTMYIIGPGTTTRSILDQLDLEKTLIGVDVVCGGSLTAADANESDILELIRGRKSKIIVTPIGGQGCIFGRGNQQISPEVIRTVGRENIIIVATPGKLHSLTARPLWVDTGDVDVDRVLHGHYRVVTGVGDEAVCRVSG
ncbi:ATP-NAD kinase family protein [Candidatus Zixiibacteriota bacterium]